MVEVRSAGIRLTYRSQWIMHPRPYFGFGDCILKFSIVVIQLRLGGFSEFLDVWTCGRVDGGIFEKFSF